MLVTRVLNLTEEYATLLVPRASYESLAGAVNVGGVAGCQAPASKTSGALRTQSLDRGAVARIVASATNARNARTLVRRGSQDGGCRGKL